MLNQVAPHQFNVLDRNLKCRTCIILKILLLTSMKVRSNLNRFLWKRCAMDAYVLTTFKAMLPLVGKVWIVASTSELKVPIPVVCSFVKPCNCLMCIYFCCNLCNYKVDNEIVYVQIYIYMFLLLMQHTQYSIKHAFFNKTYITLSSNNTNGLLNKNELFVVIYTKSLDIMTV